MLKTKFVIENTLLYFCVFLQPRYAIQGLGAQFVARLEGSYSGVMGLPLFETAELLGRVGIKIV